MNSTRFLKPSDCSSYYDKNEPNIAETTNFIYNKYYSLSLEVQKQKLPIYNYKNHIIYLLENYQTLVIIGETSSGKSTQIPQYMVEAGWPGVIGITEPRKVSAISLARRVAEETHSFVQGENVGYSVRFDTCKKEPKIKYMTEGILLSEMYADPLLTKYSAIMIDEIHERTLYTDILMGLLKKILRKRTSLKLIIASATFDAEKIYNFFNHKVKNDKDSAVILSIQGRTHPVSVYYAKEPVPDYIQATVDTILKIHKTEESGDILAFLTGQEEVDRTVSLLRDSQNSEEISVKKYKMSILPMYGALINEEQLKVFKGTPKDTRKIIIATNIAETSVTIPGIVYVVDCGFVKQRWYNYKTNIDSLVVLPISKNSAAQRAGRAGRMRPGKCYRLYTEESFENLPQETIPEIQRTNLSAILLQLKALGIDNILRFKWLDPPPAKHLWTALQILYALGALNNSGNLTKPLGFNMSEFILDPIYAKILLSSGEFGCTEEILTIISLLQVETIFAKPASGNSQIRARVQKRNFEVEEGDLLTLLNIYTGWTSAELARDYCHRNFLNYQALRRVSELRDSLASMLKKYNVPFNTDRSDTETIRKCLITGLFPNAAYLHYSGTYRTVKGNEILHINSDSVLYTIPPPSWVIYCDIIHTNKTFMRNITAIKSEWLLEIAPHYYNRVTEYRN